MPDSTVIAAVVSAAAALAVAGIAWWVKRASERPSAKRREFFDLDEARERILQLEAERVEATRDRESLRDQVRQLRASIPALLVAAGLDKDAASWGEALDEIDQGIVISSPQNDGSFLWVNRAFADGLGYTKAELLTTPWRSLVHPEDMKQTSRAEAAAYHSAIRLVNRYRTKSGGWRTLRWCSPRYQQGCTLSVVRFENGVHP